MKDETGRLKEVHIKPSCRQIGGIDVPMGFKYNITADKEMVEVIRAVEGVKTCYNHIPFSYDTTIDGRYDEDIVLENVTLALVEAQSK